MTLRQPNYDRMLQLGLHGMAEAMEEQYHLPGVEELGFDDRLAMLLEREVQQRHEKSYRAQLRQAQLRIRAEIQDVDCSAGRGITRTALTQLAAGDWIRDGLNLIVEGSTGTGKTFLACALAHQACLQKHSALYRRVPELVSSLARARDKGPVAHERLMRRLGKVALLVLDDWGLQGFSAEGRRDLLEIVEGRHGRKSILIASQRKLSANLPLPMRYLIVSFTVPIRSICRESPNVNAIGHRCSVVRKSIQCSPTRRGNQRHRRLVGR